MVFLCPACYNMFAHVLTERFGAKFSFRCRHFADWFAEQVEQGSAGLPVGVQVVARHWREDITLAVMAALEAHFRSTPDYPEYPASDAD